MTTKYYKIILDENWRKTPQSKWADASLTNRVIYDALAAGVLDGVRESEYRCCCYVKMTTTHYLPQSGAGMIYFH